MGKKTEKEEPEKWKEKWEMRRGDKKRGQSASRRMQLLCSVLLRG